MPTRLQLYILGHDRPALQAACARVLIPHCPVYLPELAGVPAELAGNQIAENRFFLSERAEHPGARYVGIFTYRYDHKYRAFTTRLRDFAELSLSLNTVYGPSVSKADWLEDSDRHHPGIAKIILDAANQLGFDTTPRVSVYCNNFILDLLSYREFLKDWRAMFWAIHNRYGLDLPFTGDAGIFSNRRAGLVYERVSMLLLSRYVVAPIP